MDDKTSYILVAALSAAAGAGIVALIDRIVLSNDIAYSGIVHELAMEAMAELREGLSDD